MKYPLVIIAFIVFTGIFFSMLNSKAEDYSVAYGKDFDNITDINSNVQVDAENPFKGILSEKGLFSNTGNQLKSDGRKIKNLFFSVIYGLIASIVLFFIVKMFLQRR